MPITGTGNLLNVFDQETDSGIFLVKNQDFYGRQYYFSATNTSTAVPAVNSIIFSFRWPFQTKCVIRNMKYGLWSIGANPASTSNLGIGLRFVDSWTVSDTAATAITPSTYGLTYNKLGSQSITLLTSQMANSSNPRSWTTAGVAVTTAAVSGKSQYQHYSHSNYDVVINASTVRNVRISQNLSKNLSRNPIILSKDTGFMLQLSAATAITLSLRWAVSFDFTEVDNTLEL